MLALLLPPPAGAQKGGAAATGPGPCQTPAGLVASQTTICQGGSAVLAVNEGCAPVAYYTYTWAPNQDISATTGGQVVVNPLVTTTYSVTGTASGAATQVFSVTVAVQANCCQQGTARNIVELTGNYYGYNPSLPNTGDPFRDYPPGTYFHLAAGTVTLDNNQFQPPTGSVLLMDAGADLVLTDARLLLNGVTITAACDEMWGRVHEFNNGHGIEAGPVQTLRPRLMHSLGGLVQEDKLLNSSRLRLNQMDFLHNYQSLALNFVTGPAHNTDFVKNCRFDSDPDLLKSPYKANTQDYWFSQQHVSLRGDAGLLGFAENSLRHAMLGIVLLKGGLPALKVDHCQFGEMYLAGIIFADDYNPGPDARLTVQNSRFTFPVGTALPPTSQVAQTVAGSFALNANESVGLAPLLMPTYVSNTVFEQPSTALYRSFQYGTYRPRQVGIAGHKLTQVLDNTFQGLAVGIAHRLRDGDTNTEVRGNLFSECEKGYDLVPVDPASNPATPTGTAYLSCNTFARTVSNSTRSGTSYGIYNESYSNVTLANPQATAGNPTVLKNAFEDAGANAPGFYALYNANTSASLSYYSYDNYSQQLLSLTNAPRVQLTGIGTAPTYVNGTACVGISLNGLQRTAIPATGPPTTADAPQLEQNVPNPAQGTASIAYHVPKGAHTASLLVRHGLDGHLMTALPVVVAASRCEVKLAGYPTGTYFYTLVVDGLPVATRRLVVE